MMDLVRVKYEGEESLYTKLSGAMVKWEPGDVRLYPRRLWEREKPRGPFKLMRGRKAETDLPLPIPVYPNGLMSQRELEASIQWYPRATLEEMLSHYSQAGDRFRRSTVHNEIERRDGERETD